MEKDKINLKDNNKNLNLVNNNSKKLKKIKIQKVMIKKNHYKQRLNRQKSNHITVKSNVEIKANSEVVNSTNSIEIKNYKSIEPFLESIKYKNKKPKDSSFVKNNENINLKNSKSEDFPISKVEQKKASIEQKKTNLEKRIRKNYSLKFSKTEEILTEYGIQLNTKFKPHLEFKGFQQKNTFSQKLFQKPNDTIRNHIHNKINENEDDNHTLKALHSIEKTLESRLINFSRNSNFRKIEKYYNLENKLKNIDVKQNFNSLKTECNLNFSGNKTIKPTQKLIQRQRNRKRILKKEYLIKKSIKFKNKILRNTSIFTISPFKMLSPLMVFFPIILFITIFFSMFMSFDNSNSLYDLQKADLYYRKLEAELLQEENITINHDPIDLASILILMFEDFEYNDEIETSLSKLFLLQKELQISFRQLINLSIPEFLYDDFLALYETKCGLIKYGSPFDFEYERFISSYVGYRKNPTGDGLQLHKGLDIAVDSGTPIQAIADGVVTSAYFSESYGNVVIIYHNDNYQSLYAHQLNYTVETGQRVEKGEVIGFVRSTGDSTGNHLHLEILDEIGSNMNPIFLIERWTEIE